LGRTTIEIDDIEQAYGLFSDQRDGVATTLAILAAPILATRIFTATKLPAGMFTPFKFTRLLAVTQSPTGIFAALKFTTV
jgi:hypothetical protein